MFAGISSTLGDIYGVRFEGLTAVNAPNDFAINNVSVNAASTTVPEPSSVVLVASGLLGLAGAARRRRKPVA